MFVITHRRFFFWLTGLLLAAALAAIITWGLPLGIDFTGGSLVQVAYSQTPPPLEDVKALAEKVVGSTAVRSSLDGSVTLRTISLSPELHESLLAALGSQASTTELAFTSVGPALGSQFAHKALWAILAVVLVIMLYIAFAFRKVRGPVPGWGYGITVVVMLAIDIVVPTGFYAALAHYTSAQVDSLFIVALLALLGYCVNDVIVIFDRIREHLARNERENKKESFEETIGKSISETVTRSINTALTVVLALVALIYFGAPATRDFALVMLVGVVAGTFSSICRSAPLLIPIARWFKK